MQLLLVILAGLSVYLIALNIREYRWMSTQISVARATRMIVDARQEYLLDTLRQHTRRSED